MADLARNHGPDGSIVVEHHWTAAHVAGLLSITAATVKKYAASGAWPHARPPGRGGGSPVFCQHDIDAILQTYNTDGPAR